MDALLLRVDSVSGALSDVAKTVKIEFVQEGGIQDLRKTIASTNALVQQLNTVAAEQSRGLTLTMNALQEPRDGDRLDVTRFHRAQHAVDHAQSVDAHEQSRLDHEESSTW